MSHERFLLDMETQHDFFVRGGSCYREGASEAAKRIYALFAMARTARIPVISTVLRVRATQLGPLADVPHCIDGTRGERKLAGTVLRRRINLGLRNTTDLPPDLLERYQQVIVEKRHTDILKHARLERLITRIGHGTFLLCGAGVAGGLAEAAIGLRSRGFQVIVAADAVLDLGHLDASMARRRMKAKGSLFLPTRQIVATVTADARRHRRLRRIVGTVPVPAA